MRRLKIFLIILLLISMQSVAVAEGKKTYTIDQIATQIQNKSGAQILSAKVQQTQQGKIYRFKVKKNGRIRVLLVRPDGTRINP